MSTSARLINYEDSLTMPENRFEEIVHGESRIMPPSTKWHDHLVWVLAKMLEQKLAQRDYEVHFQGTGLGIERIPLTYRIPDLMVYRTEALRQDRAQTARNDPYIWAVPELIVECLSPSSRKGAVQELLADYARIAVPEVWLLDPKLPRFTSYRYESGALREWLTAETGQIAPVRMPEVIVDVPQLWAAFEG